MGYTPAQRARLLARADAILGPPTGKVSAMTPAQRRRYFAAHDAKDRQSRAAAQVRARQEIARCLTSFTVRMNNQEAREVALELAWKARGHTYTPSAHAKLMDDGSLIRTATALRWSDGRPVTAKAPALTAKPDTGTGRTMVIDFSPFGAWYEINSRQEGHFLERTVFGAFADTIREDKAQMRSQFDHGTDPYIGSKPLGRITKLEETWVGPRGEVELLDATYVRDIAAGLRAGVYGSSFRFATEVDEWDKRPKKTAYNPRGIPERTIRKVRLYEFGPVTMPANPAATAGVRSA